MTELAQQYRTTQSPPQTLHNWSYWKIGWVYFKGALTIGTTPTGLDLSSYRLNCGYQSCCLPTEGDPQY
ncbi:MAG: hypothetical protein HC936_03825 [Leptolyngbyaceae cyanobacterium SU_3_3]|nr:hypothetical protein [Leptolyngbyaceae cyanobacterium SU_3_3]